MNDERRKILEELSELYRLREDNINFNRIDLYTRSDSPIKIQEVYIEERHDPKPIEGSPKVIQWFPIVKLDNGDEMIILYPSAPVRRDKAVLEDIEDAEFVEKRINRLLSLMG